MAFDPVTAAINIGSQIIDKIFPDKEAADKAKLQWMQMQQEGKLKAIEIQISAIIAEAKAQIHGPAERVRHSSMSCTP